MNVTKSEYASLRQEWNYASRLNEQARRLELDLDSREGLALYEEDPGKAERCRCLVKRASARKNRRFNLLMEIYEEMGQEELDVARLCGTPVTWKKEDQS
jgi:hypothetical protein